MADKFPFGLVLRLIAPLLGKILPWWRRLSAGKKALHERHAPYLPVTQEGTERILRSLAGSDPDDPLFQRFITSIERKILSPGGKFDVITVQKWLKQAEVQESFSKWTAARMSGSSIDTEQIHRKLALSYAEETGEDAIFARDVIPPVIELLVAETNESMTDSDKIVAGLISRKLDKLTITDNITVQAHTQEAQRELAIICKKRLLSEFKAKEKIALLADRIAPQGDLRSCNHETQGEVLYWAARLHADKKDRTKAKDYLDMLRQKAPNCDQTIPAAWIAYHEGRTEDAKTALSGHDNPDGRTNLLLMLSESSGPETAIQWWENTTPTEAIEWLSVRGHQILARLLSEVGRWEDAARLLNDLPDSAWQEYPALPYITGVANVAVFLPDLARQATKHVEMLPLHAPEVEPIIRQDIQTWREKAFSSFAKSQEIGKQVDEPLLIRRALAWIAWLKLTDPITREEGKAMVVKAMTDGAVAAIFIGLARAFRIEIDTTPLSKYLKASNLTGQLNGEARFAELELMRYGNNPEILESYLLENINQLLDCLIPCSYYCLLADVLLDQKKFKDAQTIVDEHSNDLGDDTRERFIDRIRSEQGEDVGESLLQRFKRTGEEIDLHNLCHILQRSGDYNTLSSYSAELCQRSATPEHIMLHVQCLSHLKEDKSLAEFLENHSTWVNGDSGLLGPLAMTYYFLGRLDDANNALKRKSFLSASPTDDAMRLNLALHSGCWEAFPAILAKIRANQDTFSALELVRLAYLTADFAQHDAVDFLQDVVRSNQTDAMVLMNAGMLASQLGRDDIAMPWLANSQALSTKEQDLWQKKSLKEAGELMMAQREMQSDLNQRWIQGQITIHQFASSMNVALTTLLFQEALYNKRRADPRHRTVLSIRPGNRLLWQTGFIKEVIADISTLIQLSALDLLTVFFNRFDLIYLPWSIMPQLLHEQHRLRFHQPSQVKKAKSLWSVVDNSKNVRIIDPQISLPEWLVQEVGYECAALLVAAKNTNGRMVHLLPVHKIGASNISPALLREYAENVLSLRQVMLWLENDGYVDNATATKAGIFIEPSVAQFVQVSDGVNIPCPKYDGIGPLYLSWLAAEQLFHANILENLVVSGQEIFLSKETVEEAHALVHHEENAKQAIDLLQTLRIKLRDALTTGKVRLLPRQTTHETNDITGDTWLEIFSHFNHNQGICVDDRHLGRLGRFQHDDENHTAFLIDTIDLLHDFVDTQHITQSNCYTKLYELRRRGFQLIPTDDQELLYLLKTAKIDQLTGDLQETAELRAIRESWLRFRSLDMLENLDEARYAEAMGGTAMIVADSLWQDQSVTTELAAAGSSWLYRTLFTWPWEWPSLVHHQEWQDQFLERRLQLLVSRIFPFRIRDPERQKHYQEWLQVEIMDPLTLSAPEVLDRLAEGVKSYFEKLTDEILYDNQG